MDCHEDSSDPLSLIFVLISPLCFHTYQVCSWILLGAARVIAHSVIGLSSCWHSSRQVTKWSSWMLKVSIFLGLHKENSLGFVHALLLEDAGPLVSMLSHFFLYYLQYYWWTQFIKQLFSITDHDWSLSRRWWIWSSVCACWMDWTKNCSKCFHWWKAYRWLRQYDSVPILFGLTASAAF